MMDWRLIIEVLIASGIGGFLGAFIEQWLERRPAPKS
jgi:uncharacterized membrane protein YfcA